jgi:cytochrome c oxidase subunit 2
MAIHPPENRDWWREPIERTELLWIGLSLVWAIVMFAMMPYWHIYGEQNLSNETYRVTPEAYQAKVEAFVAEFGVGEEGDTGVPIVRPPAGADIYMLARLWEWWPVLELEKGQSYRLHLSSVDWQHGFSLQPTNINIQVHPGYEHIITVTPTESGVFGIVCNEFCGLGHHTMVGRVRVVEGGS